MSETDCGTVRRLSTSPMVPFSEGLLLLCSQLELWHLPFLIKKFLNVTIFLFFNPTIEVPVVTFSLRGWCMLGVFLLPVFTRLGHEHQDLFSLCSVVCTD